MKYLFIAFLLLGACSKPAEIPETTARFCDTKGCNFLHTFKKAENCHAFTKELVRSLSAAPNDEGYGVAMCVVDDRD